MQAPYPLRPIGAHYVGVPGTPGCVDIRDAMLGDADARLSQKTGARRGFTLPEPQVF
jgi:hypothetical protein